eukprot:CAMPEP_0204462024 /NCGR_PEP_ID=MMETSP0471-20130131/5874_1 /ASSEMBLY_ACC=CAM_ASM_000602 /TAXON_ID=2969 /ORGANISM="Oxyrrhis marina" /LENGTH=51 /DNA_ID=CAMNT_0051463131 /DNA_START=3 /DNA_END=155 /DNA_ORIENTATION=+
MTGEHLGRFGEGLGHCAQLTSLVLNFSWNEMTGEHLGRFGEGIGHCAQLTS